MDGTIQDYRRGKVDRGEKRVEHWVLKNPTFRDQQEEGRRASMEIKKDLSIMWEESQERVRPGSQGKTVLKAEAFDG